MADDAAFWAPRVSFREPVREIFIAQGYLGAAAEAHLCGNAELVERLLEKADIPAIREWTESIWGWGLNKHAIIRFREVPGLPLPLPAGEARMPTVEVRKRVVERDGWHCRFCSIPLIGKQVREAIRARYSLRWSNANRNAEQHWAFQCMWAQYDHVVPRSRGGDNSFENLLMTCAPCNFGRANYLLDEVGLLDPRERPAFKSDWDGLERFLQSPPP